MGNFFKDLLKDKYDNYSLREVIIAISMALVIMSWIAQLLFGITTPEYMFYSIVSLVAAGCFGYSLERRGRINKFRNYEEDQQNNCQESEEKEDEKKNENPTHKTDKRKKGK